MLISRRAFTGGLAGSALVTQLAFPARADDDPRYAAVLAAIRAYGEAHVRHFRLPGLTLGIAAPDGFSTVLNFGYANADARTPAGPGTLFQIGSISKLTNAAILHQLAGQGRLSLSSRVSDLLPAIPLPAGNSITVQHLLDHVAGLPGDAPVFPEDGFWTAYAPGEHWHYSNTAYAILGRLIEHLERKPLARVAEQRIFRPLGMRQTRGAIVSDDRLLYAQGYEVADECPFAIGVPLAPAPWVDVTFGAGNVASTAADMIRLLRSIADAAQGRGGLGLDPAAGGAFTGHAVPSDEPDMTYGNGLMHVAAGPRKYLHHTGGMVAFSSSFHVDVDSRAGAFASSNLSGFAEYRPRLLTQFAVDCLTNAASGQPLPAPPSLYTPSSHAPAYIGSYAGPAGKFDIRAGDPLTIVANGKSAALQPWGGEIFRTTHPDFRQFSFMFQRSRGLVTRADWGPSMYLRSGTGVQLPASDAELARLAGRYVNDSPWLGKMPVVERGGKLWIGTETPMTRISDNLWRVGPESWSPERGSFTNFIDGRPQKFVFSGEKFGRYDI